MRLWAVMTFFLAAAAAQDWQNRSVVHVQANLSARWFVPVWSISNFKTETPNNTNLFAGLGYRGKTWWVEIMEQEQWKSAGHFRAFDVRFSKEFGKGCELYVEPSPFKGGLYEFVLAQCPVWRKFSIGGETENVHHAGPDVIQLGPRLARSIGRIGPVNFATGIAARVDPTGRGRTELRLYLVGNVRTFAKHER